MEIAYLIQLPDRSFTIEMFHNTACHLVLFCFFRTRKCRTWVFNIFIPRLSAEWDREQVWWQVWQCYQGQPSLFPKVTESKRAVRRESSPRKSNDTLALQTEPCSCLWQQRDLNVKAPVAPHSTENGSNVILNLLPLKVFLIHHYKVDYRSIYTQYIFPQPAGKFCFSHSYWSQRNGSDSLLSVECGCDINTGF